MKSYLLYLECLNCNTTWNETIPFGREWQNYDDFAQKTAGYGERCRNCHGLHCGESKFHTVTCSNCGSPDVIKRQKEENTNDEYAAYCKCGDALERTGLYPNEAKYYCSGCDRTYKLVLFL